MRRPRSERPSREVLIEAFVASQGNVRQAAHYLGVGSRKTVRGWLDQEQLWELVRKLRDEGVPRRGVPRRRARGGPVPGV